MVPTDQRSALASYLRCCRISGAMYSGEPHSVSASPCGPRMTPRHNFEPADPYSQLVSRRLVFPTRESRRSQSTESVAVRGLRKIAHCARADNAPRTAGRRQAPALRSDVGMMTADEMMFSAKLDRWSTEHGARRGGARLRLQVPRKAEICNLQRGFGPFVRQQQILRLQVPLQQAPRRAWSEKCASSGCILAQGVVCEGLSKLQYLQQRHLSLNLMLNSQRIPRHSSRSMLEHENCPEAGPPHSSLCQTE